MQRSITELPRPKATVHIAPPATTAKKVPVFYCLCTLKSLCCYKKRHTFRNSSYTNLANWQSAIASANICTCT